MKKRARIMVMGLVLVAMLLLATVPAAGSDATPFEAVAYICAVDPPAQEWYSDGGTVLHQRGVSAHSIIVSDEPRMNGVDGDVLHQDLNLITGDGRVWGSGAYVTDVGTWHHVFKGEYVGWALTTHAAGRGSRGLQGQVFYWDGLASFDIPEPDPCPDGALQVLFITGYILEH